MGAPIGRRMLRGAGIGLAAGLSLAGLYFALGVCGSARPILPLLQWVGLQGGLREC